ncbi:MAG: 3-phosphoshikimate 1-carboxyvinyltransferase [Bacteroidota bacterium]|nr:3-phosphoshikimate 1-carboxyvinyltransferase [Bacteroidota bacterium]
MQVTVSPSHIKGIITAPASKSAMQRACAAALIRNGETILNNPGISADDKAALGIIQQLGTKVEYMPAGIKVQSKGVQPVGQEIDCGESGLSIRMFTSIAALSEKEITVRGGGSLSKRPMQFFDDVLPPLGVAYKSNDGYLPLVLQGPLQPKTITVDGSLSSQFLTGLLFAYSAAGAQDVSIYVNNLNSRPYIDLTLKVLYDFGLKVPVNKRYQEFYYDKQPHNSSINQTLHYTIEGDWSGGAFLLVAGAIAGNVVVNGLEPFSTQADKAILHALRQAEANMKVDEQRIHIQQSALKPFQFDATDCPDLFPPLVALAAYCNGTTIIQGTNRLIHKESNRALTLQEEFGKIGVVIELQENKMLVKGEGIVKAASVSSHNDHRIAMACAVAALKSDGPVQIEKAEAVNKSYPQFWEHLNILNVHMQKMH